MRLRRFAASTLALFALCASGLPACATILLFDQTRDAATHSQVEPTLSGSSLEPDYGDRVAGPLQLVAGGQFSYGAAGEGFTPNVVVDIVGGAGMALWEQDYGDLVNVAFGLRGSNQFHVDLVADAGFEVLLFGFDLAVGHMRTTRSTLCVCSMAHWRCSAVGLSSLKATPSGLGTLRFNSHRLCKASRCASRSTSPTCPAANRTTSASITSVLAKAHLAWSWCRSHRLPGS